MSVNPLLNVPSVSRYASPKYKAPGYLFLSRPAVTGKEEILGYSVA